MTTTLRNPDAKRLWHWGSMDIPASDMDGIIEKRHNLFVIETKRPGESMSAGQSILLSAMHELGHTVCIITGHPPDQVLGWEVWHNGAKVRRQGNAQELQAMVQRWMDWATQHPRQGA